MCLLQTGKGLAEAPPFTLADIKQAIPEHCLKKDTWRSMSYLVKDVAIVLGLAVGAHSLNQWYAFPSYVKTHCQNCLRHPGSMHAPVNKAAGWTIAWFNTVVHRAGACVVICQSKLLCVTCAGGPGHFTG